MMSSSNAGRPLARVQGSLGTGRGRKVLWPVLCGCWAVVGVARSDVTVATGFEKDEGYVLGPIGGQQGWESATPKALVGEAPVRTGTQALILEPESRAHWPVTAADQLATVDFHVQAVPVDVAPAPGLGVSTAVYLDAQQGLMCLDGDGAGGGTWVATGSVPDKGSWFRVTLRLDQVTKRWDCLVDGTVVRTSLGYVNANVNSLGRVSFAADGGPAAVDDLSVTTSVPAPGRPQLSVARGTQDVTLSWPAGFDGFTLQSSPTALDGSWTPVSGVLNNSAIVPTARDAEFFRLFHP